MKKMKRFIAIAAAIAMLAVANAVPAFAAGQPTGTLTMEDQNGNAKTSSSYSAYQIATFDADKLNGKTVFTNMKLNSQNGAAYKMAIINSIPSLKGTTPTDDQLFLELSKVQDRGQEAVNLADALATTVVGQKEDYDAVKGKFDSLPYGYYLVMETANGAGDGTIISKPILVCVPDRDTGATDVVAKVKTSKAGIEKKIVETDPQDKHTIYVDTNTTAIGKDVTYRSISTFPVYSKDATGIDYTVTDTFSQGLSFDLKTNPISVGIMNDSDPKGAPPSLLAPGKDYTLTTQKEADGSTVFKLSLLDSDRIKSWGNLGCKLQIMYSATLNSYAQTGPTGNPNSVQLTYSVKPGDATSDYTTPPDTVITYTYKLAVTKKSNTGDLLPGATFDLRDSAGNTIETKTTDEKGSAVFTQLEQGNYSLVETKAPQGYNLLSDPIKFTLTAQNKEDGSPIPNDKYVVSVSGNSAAQGSVFAKWLLTPVSGSCTFSQTDATVLGAEITNSPGFVLPGTGGIGTVIFTVGGIAILLVGGCMAFLYFRKKKKSERQ